MDLFWADDGRLRAGWRFLLAVLLFVFVNAFTGDLANSWAGPSDRKFELLFRPLFLVLLLVMFSALLKIFDRVEGNPLVAMGLGRIHLFHDVAIGIIAGAVMVGLAVLPIAIGFHVGFRLILSRHSLKLALAVVFILATGAMAEEVAFRGYPFQRLVEATGSIAAILLSSALFGSLHLRNPHASAFGLINTVVIGIVLAVAYLRTKALWLPWGLHFGWNLTLGLLFGLPVSGIQQFAVVVRGTASGPVWLTGGAYGIEAGMAGTLAIGAGFIFVLFGIKNRPGTLLQAPSEEKSLIDSDPGGIQVNQGSGSPGAG
jgi:uncharacterized protein